MVLTALALVGLVGGLFWELRHPEPFINLRLMRDRSFLVGCIIIFSTYAVLYGSILLLPQMMQGLMRYDATNAGLVLSPAGIFSMITMIASALILRLKVDARWLIAVGGAVMAAGSYMLATLNLQAGPLQIVWPRVVQMAGAGLMFAPLAAASVLYLPKTEMNNASGLFNMLRNEGSSVGIGLSTAVLQRRLQFHSFRLTESLQPLSDATTAALETTGRFFTQVTGDPARGQLMGLRAIRLVRDQQAYAQAFLDCFWVFTLIALATVPAGLPDEAVGGRGGGAHRRMNNPGIIHRETTRSERLESDQGDLDDFRSAEKPHRRADGAGAPGNEDLAAWPLNQAMQILLTISRGNDWGAKARHNNLSTVGVPAEYQADAAVANGLSIVRIVGKHDHSIVRRGISQRGLRILPVGPEIADTADS